MANVVRWRTILTLLGGDRRPVASVGGQEGALAPGVQLGDGTSIQATHEAISPSALNDTEWSLGHSSAARLRWSKLSLVREYEADALGDPDPAWRGPEPRSVQDSAAHLLLSDWLALWLVRPVDLGPAFLLHMEDRSNGWILRHITHLDEFVAVPHERSDAFSTADLEKARHVAEALRARPYGTPLGVALTVTHHALTQHIWEFRYAVLWMALEMLLGAKDGGEVTRTLATRAAVLLEDSLTARERRAKAVRVLYGARSKIVHGRAFGSDDPTLVASLRESESLLRDVLRRVLLEPALSAAFDGSDRDAFLERLVLGGSK